MTSPNTTPESTVSPDDELKVSLSKPCLLYTSDAADDIALV